MFYVFTGLEKDRMLTSKIQEIIERNYPIDPENMAGLFIKLNPIYNALKVFELCLFV